VRSVVASRPDFKLVLTGIDPSDRPRLGSHIAAHGIDGAVVVAEKLSRSELLWVIKNSAVLVMPSMLGPTNYPPLEAMALGTKVLMSDVHAFDFALPNFVHLVSTLDSEVWARKIISAFVDRQNEHPFLVDSAFVERFTEILVAFRAQRNLWD
jgi:glycosyltransferase involved in cell wall biosynthesis